MVNRFAVALSPRLPHQRPQPPRRLQHWFDKAFVIAVRRHGQGERGGQAAIGLEHGGGDACQLAGAVAHQGAVALGSDIGQQSFDRLGNYGVACLMERY